MQPMTSIVTPELARSVGDVIATAPFEKLHRIVLADSDRDNIASAVQNFFLPLGVFYS